MRPRQKARRKKARSGNGSLAQRNLEKGFAVSDEILAHPEQFPDDFLCLPLDSEVIGHILSPERVRLLRVLRDDGPFDSIGALAAALGRDATRVSRDVTDLEVAGLVASERKGKEKRLAATRRFILLV